MLSQSLYDACKTGDYATVEDLVQGGIYTNALDQTGYPYLYWAAKGGHESVCHYLLKYSKYDINSAHQPEGDNALHLMARYGFLSQVQFLIENRRMDALIKNNNDETAREISIKNGHTLIAEYLVGVKSWRTDSDSSELEPSLSIVMHDASSNSFESKTSSSASSSSISMPSPSSSPIASMTSPVLPPPSITPQLPLSTNNALPRSSSFVFAPVSSHRPSLEESKIPADNAERKRLLLERLAFARSTRSSSNAESLLSLPSVVSLLNQLEVKEDTVEPLHTNLADSRSVSPSPALSENALKLLHKRQEIATQKIIKQQEESKRVESAKPEEDRMEKLKAQLKEKRRQQVRLKAQQEVEQALAAKRAEEKSRLALEVARRNLLKQKDKEFQEMRKHNVELHAAKDKPAEIDAKEVEAEAARELLVDAKRPVKKVQVRKSPPYWNEPPTSLKFWGREEEAIVHTYSLNRDGDLQERVARHRVRMHKNAFSNGTMRLAFFAQDMSFDPPRRLVFKESMFLEAEVNSKEWFLRDIYSSVKARDYAEKFNVDAGINKAITYAPVWLYEFPERKTVTSKLYSAEPFLEGDWERYSNNAKYLIPPSFTNKWHTLTAFSHYSFVKSRRTEMVVDLQGIGGDGYVLTDPQIHSIAKEKFGEGDRGQRGFDDFLSAHTCNPICAKLGLPKNGGSATTGSTVASTKFAVGTTQAMFACGHTQSLSTDGLRERLNKGGCVLCDMCKSQAQKSQTKQVCHGCSKTFWCSKTEYLVLGIVYPPKYCNNCDLSLQPVNFLEE